MTAKISGEDAFAGAAGFLLAHGAETEFRPGRLGAFDDKRRGVGVELVSVRPDPAVVGLFEDESKRVIELLIGAEPNEFVLAHIDGGLEVMCEFGTRLGIQSIRRNDDIVVFGEFSGVGDFGLKNQFHAKRAGALLQQHEQLLARNAGKAVAARYDSLTAIVHRDVVPISEMGADRRSADRIVGGDVVECLVGKHHSPAERIVRPVALEYGDVVRGVAQLHADREIKPRRAAAEARNLHAMPPSCCTAASMAPPG